MGNTNRKKTVASRGVVNKKAPLKDAEPVYRPRSFVVWQKDVQVELDKKDAFVHMYFSLFSSLNHPSFLQSKEEFSRNGYVPFSICQNPG